MSEQRTVVLASLTEKSGTSSAGKAWTKYTFTDGNDQSYGTFDRKVVADVFGNEGKRFDITIEQDGKFMNLLSATLAKQPAGDEPDWDLIGLRKTRCALWVAYLNGDIASEIVKRVPENVDKADTLIRVGTRLVAAAEHDIFDREQGDDGIPFEPREVAA